ncbi:MAG: hypothetical protein R3Y11_11095 [Pseudomonadota bacterium]
MKSRLFSAFSLVLVLALTMLLTACFPPYQHRRPSPPPKHYRKAPPPPRYRSELMHVGTIVAAMQAQHMMRTLDGESLVHGQHFLNPNEDTKLLAELDGVELVAHRILPPPPPRYHRLGPLPKKRFHRPPPPPPRHYKKPHPVPPPHPVPNHRGNLEHHVA